MDITLTSIHLFEYAKKGCLWSGARTIIQYYTIEEIDKIENMIDDMDLFQTVPTDTQVNDFIWFETEFINEQLGISQEEWDKREKQWTMED